LHHFTSRYATATPGFSELLFPALCGAGVSERSARSLLDPAAERWLFGIVLRCGALAAAKFKRRMRFNSLTV
jgi:hypothetical protein